MKMHATSLRRHERMTDYKQPLADQRKRADRAQKLRIARIVSGAALIWLALTAIAFLLGEIP